MHNFGRTCTFCRTWKSIAEQAKNYEQVDLSSKDVELIIVADTEIDQSIKSFINCLKRAKFRMATFITSEVEEVKKQLKDYDCNIIEIEPIKTLEEYNYFILWELHKLITCDYVLTVQYDGTIIYQQAWNDEFLEYDYIGSPWSKEFVIKHKRSGDYQVGNSGFCLRSARLIKALSKCEYLTRAFCRNNCYDDWTICTDETMREWIDKNGLKIAPVDIAKYFAFEMDIEHGNPMKWFGAHCRIKEHIRRFLSLK